MFLRNKILLILLGVVILYAGLDYSIQRFIVFPSFAALERDEAIRDMERCAGALLREIHHLDALSHDWSAWDDTYEYMRDRNSAYIDSNMVMSSFGDNHLNLIYLCNPAGQVLWGKIFDLETGQQIQIKEFPPDSISVSNPLLDHVRPYSSIAGVYMTEAGPMLVASRPIVTSNKKGPIRGTLIMARFLDNKVIETLAEQTRIALQLIPIGEKSMPAGEKALLGQISEEHPFLLSEVSDSVLQLRSIVPDIQGNPALLMVINLPRDIMASGNVAIRYALFSILATGLVILFVLIIMLKLTIVNPLAKLTQQVKSIVINDDLSARIDVDAVDEIGIIAEEFNKMIERLAEARQQLLDQ